MSNFLLHQQISNGHGNEQQNTRTKNNKKYTKTGVQKKNYKIKLILYQGPAAQSIIWANHKFNHYICISTMV